MSKKILIVIAIILLVAITGTVFFIFQSNKGENVVSWIVPNVLQPYIRIEKNEELSSGNLTLNGTNPEMNYFFDIYNYNEETAEYSRLDLIPYVKLNIQNENNIENVVNAKVYYIKDITAELNEENLEEITEFGQVGENFETYLKCKKINKYDEKEQNNNVAHYVAKIALNTEAEEYANLENNLTQKFEIMFGYKQAEE